MIQTRWCCHCNGARWINVQRAFCLDGPNVRVPFIAAEFLTVDGCPLCRCVVTYRRNRVGPHDRLSPYEILGPLGSGGMGEVYQARDTRLDRIVAVKILKGRHSERFEREARAIAALNHPHICALYDVGPDYLVMEYVEGKPLRGPLPAAESLRYAIQIAEALDAAHRRGIIHRDLKPSNILITKTGVKLLDFGLAKVAPGSKISVILIGAAFHACSILVLPCESRKQAGKGSRMKFGQNICALQRPRRRATY